MSKLARYINSEVEIRFPLYVGDRQEKSGKDVGKIYQGIIFQVNDKEITIVCPFKNDYTDRSGNSVKVAIIVNKNPLVTFTSLTIDNYVQKKEENQLFIIKTPTKINEKTRRAKPRVNTRTPAFFTLYSHKGTVFPLKVRRRRIKNFILDLSETGAQIATVISLPKSMRITLTLSYNNKDLAIDGDIVWTKKDRGLYRYGVNFINIAPNDKYLLKQIIIRAAREQGVMI